MTERTGYDGKLICRLIFSSLKVSNISGWSPEKKITTVTKLLARTLSKKKLNAVTMIDNHDTYLPPTHYPHVSIYPVGHYLNESS